MTKFTIHDFLDLSKTMAGEYLEGFTYPWEALPGLGDEIIRLGKLLDPEIYEEIKPYVWVAKDAVIYDSAYIEGPSIIGEKTEVRHCAFIRGRALVGKNCVVGNSCELKNVILFDNVQTPHYNYVGDSILGYKAHMGAGSITSNVKGDHGKVGIRGLSEGFEPAYPDVVLKTDLVKFGAILGDFAEIGCNTVMNPGTLIGRHTQIYPLSLIRGFIPANSIFKPNRDKAGSVIIQRQTKK